MKSSLLSKAINPQNPVSDPNSPKPLPIKSLFAVDTGCHVLHSVPSCRKIEVAINGRLRLLQTVRFYYLDQNRDTFVINND